MKKIIIMSLALFAFALVGCGKDDTKKDDEKKAECEKDATKQWNADKKECEAKADAGTPAATDYTYKNLLAEAVTVSAEGKKDVSLAQNECVTIPADAKMVKVAEGEKVYCDGDAATTDIADCKAANQEVKVTTEADADATPAVAEVRGLADAAAAGANCKAMEAAQ